MDMQFLKESNLILTVEPDAEIYLVWHPFLMIRLLMVAFKNYKTEGSKPKFFLPFSSSRTVS